MRYPFAAVGVGILLSGATAPPVSAQVIFEDDFNDNSAGWAFESLTGNFGLGGSDAVFGFDYSTVGIPEAPNSQPGAAATSGVRLRTNTGGLPTDQAAIALESDDFSGPYRVQVDMWLNWPPDAAAIGTTIHGGLYVGDARSSDDISTNEPIQRGAGFIADTDGDCGNCDYILLKNQFELDTFSGQYSVVDFGFGNQPGIDDSDFNTDPAQGALIDLPAFFPSFSVDDATNGQQNAGIDQPEGALGFQWVTVVAEVDPTAVGNGPNTADLGTASFSVINTATGQTLPIGTVDNSQPDILDDDGDGDDCDTSEGSEDICNNLNNPLEGDVPVDLEGRISLALIDFFAGAGSNINLSFALFDNLIVTPLADGLAGDYNDDGVVDAADYTIWRDTLGGTEDLAADGDGDGEIDIDDYLVWSNAFGTSATTAVAAPEPGAAALLGFGVASWLTLRRRQASAG